jgi:hypothetical protein
LSSGCCNSSSKIILSLVDHSSFLRLTNIECRKNGRMVEWLNGWMVEWPRSQATHIRQSEYSMCDRAPKVLEPCLVANSRLSLTRGFDTYLWPQNAFYDLLDDGWMMDDGWWTYVIGHLAKYKRSPSLQGVVLSSDNRWMKDHRRLSVVQVWIPTLSEGV